MRRSLVMAALMLLAVAAVASPAAGVVLDTTGGRLFVVTLGPAGNPNLNPNATGTALVTINPGQEEVCYDIVVSNIDEPVEPAPGLGSAHIHGPLPSTGIAVDLKASFTQIGPSTFEATGCVSADRETLIAILRNPELFYINIHTALEPGGAAQGFLTR
jgi:hypothetical protein